jgi:hypothetical protein
MQCAVASILDAWIIAVLQFAEFLVNRTQTEQRFYDLYAARLTCRHERGLIDYLDHASNKGSKELSSSSEIYERSRKRQALSS